MANIALIACTKTKADKASPAALLYRSPLFRKSLLYALSHTDCIYILSAKYGVLKIDDVIEPYELSIKNLNARQKSEWTNKVDADLVKLIKPADKIHLLAGLEYSRPLLETFQKIGCSVTSPLAGMSLGHRISWLRENNHETELFIQFNKFYEAMQRLYVGQNSGRALAECTGKMAWPKRGVYYLFESSELLGTKKFRPLKNRVIRVGTHGVSRGSKATLWNRISTHRGVIAGAGNHRSSIFRLHVGAALIRKSPKKWRLPYWGTGQTADAKIQENERLLEHQVSKTLGRMTLLWLNVPDDPSPNSDRSYLERNSIGLLSRVAILAGGPSADWLGTWSKQIRIAMSGLWNLDHLYKSPDEHFPAILAKYVDVTLGKIEEPKSSLAPVAWYGPKQAPDSSQLSLFTNDPRTAPKDRK